MGYADARIEASLVSKCVRCVRVCDAVSASGWTGIGSTFWQSRRPRVPVAG